MSDQTKFRPGQHVRHPLYGRAVFLANCLGSSTEALISIGIDGNRDTETVTLAELENEPWLGPTWKVELPPAFVTSTHFEVDIRVGTVGSRALAGTIVLRRDEAESFALAMASLGAEIERA